MLDEDTREVWRANEPIKLTATEFKRSTISAVSSIMAERAYYGAVILPAKLNSTTTVTMVSTEDRAKGEGVTGTGIPR